MTDLKEYLDYMMEQHLKTEKTIQDVILFLESNDWFGRRPEITDGAVLLSADDISAITDSLRFFLENEGSSEVVYSILESRFPETASYLSRFFDLHAIDEDIRFFIYDHLAYNLKKEIFFCSDAEISELLVQTTDDTLKHHGDALTFFLAWLRKKTRTRYYKDYIMNARYTMDIQNEAYDMDDYLKLLYYLLCPEYIEDNDMYRKAAESSSYTDAWLYLSLHFISSLRDTDKIRLYHPDLPYSAEETLNRIAEGSFTPNDARETLLSITERLCVLPLNPNKTSDKQGIESVKFFVPVSCEVHYGTLFALAEAYRQIKGTPEEPLIRKVSSYQEIRRYLGDEIGELFRTSDFRTRSATKSYLQSIFMLSGDVLGESDAFGMQSYMIASIARSHKGGYGTFASTTIEYLKDAKLHGLTPEYIIFQLLERGVLSFIPSILLKMVTEGIYDQLSVSQQTELVKVLDLAPLEVETLVSVTAKARKQAQTIVLDSVQQGGDIMGALQRIANGRAFSKQNESLCLRNAFGLPCICPENRQCIGCGADISTRSTFYHILSEIKRIKGMYLDSENNAEKEKYKYLFMEILVPRLDEMLLVIKENYGTEMFHDYESLVKEYFA